MKRIVALMLLAVLGFVVAGCASAKKTVARSTTATRPAPKVSAVSSGAAIMVTGTATIPDVKPGTSISCKGGPRVRVPARGVMAAVKGPAPSTRLRLSRSVNGTVTVTCTHK